MLRAGINVLVVKIATGMEDDVINDCTIDEYELNKRRYINPKVRYVETYDKLGTLDSVKSKFESIQLKIKWTTQKYSRNILFSWPSLCG